MNSQIAYSIAADKATAEGFRPGSHAWWDAIRYHKTFPQAFAADPPQETIDQRNEDLCLTG